MLIWVLYLKLGVYYRYGDQAYLHRQGVSEFSNV